MYDRNARRHDAQQIGQIMNSIKTFGFMNPILVDQHKTVIAGHGRLQAALELGLSKVPVIENTHLTEPQIKAYRLADNKLAENASWDDGLLRIELRELVDLEFADGLEFDLSVTGFDTAELDILLDAADVSDEAETATEPLTVSVCRPGETWVLGEHKIVCGSSLDLGTHQMLLGSQDVSLILTDPPYNVPVLGHVRSHKRQKHKEFVMASGEMSSAEFTAFLMTAFKTAIEHVRPGGIVMSFIDWRHLTELDTVLGDLGLEHLNLCVWVKTNGGMGSLYRSQHELCGIYKLPGARHVNNVMLGAHGRNRTNVWQYRGVNSFGKGRAADLEDHPTVKPVAMIEDAIKDVTAIGDIVFDPFGGSGTTLIAAERCRRRARLVEIDPTYVDVTIRRWQELTGLTATSAETDEAWTERAATVEALVRIEEESSDV
jgi:DNA modification methylase